MIKIGITGQSGFIGTHLYNYLSLKNEVKLIPFNKKYFEEKIKLEKFVKQCDTIIHLAGLNRHKNPKVIYDTNIKLVKDLINACDNSNTKPHIILASSTQESKDNLYGKSKKDSRMILEKWARKHNIFFTAMIIPNVFGPFGRPYYNSVIATFCYQITHNEMPEIKVDNELKLIYINELVEEFWKRITRKGEKNKIEIYNVPYTSIKKVSEILIILKNFENEYYQKSIIPKLKNKFELNLFNTFRCYIPADKYPIMLKKYTNEQGIFGDLISTEIPGKFSYSILKNGVIIGNQFHTNKIKRLVVIKGKAKIELRRVGTEKIISFLLDGEKPSFVDMPIWTTYSIANIGNTELYIFSWTNEPYDPNDPDTYFEPVHR